MTASALNSATIAAAGPAGAAASAKATAGAGAAGGFDALLAALFPQGAPADAQEAAAPAAAAAPQAAAAAPQAAAPLFAPTADVQPDADGAPVDDALSALAPEAAGAGSDAATVLAAAQVAQQGPTVQPAEITAKAPATPAPGHDKAVKGAPAQPAILNANPRADLAGKFDLAAETTDEPAAPPAETDEESPSAHTPAAAQKGLAQAAAKAAPQSAVAANATAPAPAPTPDIQPDAPAAPTPAPAEAAAPEPPPSEVAAPQAQALAAGQSAPKAEPPPAPAARSQRSERAKAVAEAESHTDLKPAQAPEKPAQARAVEGAAKSAAASTEAKGPEPAEPRAESIADAPEASVPAETRAAANSAAPGALANHAVRGSPETVAHLAAQIIKKLEGQSTRFDLELNPQGLGKVDVRVEIGAHGLLTASMLFDNAQAAQELKSRAAELQRALEQAGFDLTGGLSFDVADNGRHQGQAWQEQAENGRAFRGQAFQAALETAGDAADAAAQGALRLRRGVNAGLDLRI